MTTLHEASSPNSQALWKNFIADASFRVRTFPVFAAALLKVAWPARKQHSRTSSLFGRVHPSAYQLEATVRTSSPFVEAARPFSSSCPMERQPKAIWAPHADS